MKKVLVLIVALLSITAISACQINYRHISTVTIEPTSTFMPIITITPIKTKIIEPTKTPQAEYKKFSVVASYLWIRDKNENRIEYLKNGEEVFCMPLSSGWCLMQNGNRVWQGCLNENMGFGCKKK